MGNLRGM